MDSRKGARAAPKRPSAGTKAVKAVRGVGAQRLRNSPALDVVRDRASTIRDLAEPENLSGKRIKGISPKNFLPGRLKQIPPRGGRIIPNADGSGEKSREGGGL
uniref:Uncharacterized protein n=1 Tax=uncultured marine bacterium MedDCM-OCT-S01-C143 TaxID=743046 RepID=D6PCC8_9BACT|nr:hypothetical protein [uncultured marine bacterium MedDCM-OCT-S01-C143]